MQLQAAILRAGAWQTSQGSSGIRKGRYAYQPHVEASISKYECQRLSGAVVNPHRAALQEAVLQQHSWLPASRSPMLMSKNYRHSAPDSRGDGSRTEGICREYKLGIASLLCSEYRH